MKTMKKEKQNMGESNEEQHKRRETKDKRKISRKHGTKHSDKRKSKIMRRGCQKENGKIL